MSNLLAHVALNIPRSNLFSYLIPEGLADSIKPGHLVYVPLGKRKEIGLVVETGDCGEQGPDALKDIKGIKEILELPFPDPVMEPVLLDLAKWISDYYICPIGITIRALIPTGLIPEKIVKRDGSASFRPRGKERLEKYLSIRLAEEQVRDLLPALKKRAPKQCAILERILSCEGKASIPELFSGAQIPHAAVRSLIDKGILEIHKAKVFRDPYASGLAEKRYESIVLTPDQQKTLDCLSAHLDKGSFSPFLIHGVTGSGKTEVYLRLIMKALEKGLQAIILVPEIAITHQLIDRFKFYLSDRIAILHSHLSEGERLDEWIRIKKGFADVVIGARSAVFAPLSRLGVIICDEEHDQSYKQGSPPRYNGRDVAIIRAKMSGCLICLASATPSLESYYNTQTKKYTLLSLPSRVTPHPRPPVIMIDMREERTEKDEETIFTKRLTCAIHETLRKKEQALIFQNRRGHSPFLLCPGCGYVPKCPNCSVSLTYHLTDHQLRCHYCDFQTKPSQFCPDCKEIPLRHMGYGTQRLEQETKAIFPDSRIARMDRDTTTRKGAHHRIIDRVERGETDILIGTQMITKGLDLPNVTLVGVIGTDHALNLPDFRSTERVFQLITQVAGRAGRGNNPGMVFVQTFYPNHYSLSCAGRHDYLAFYNREIGFRRRLLYPPFTRLVCLIIKGKDRKVTRRAAIFISKQIRQNMKSPGLMLLGPAMAPLFRLRGKYRYQIMLKAKDYRDAHRLVRDALCLFSSEKGFTGVKVDVDVDPVNLL